MLWTTWVGYPPPAWPLSVLRASLEMCRSRFSRALDSANQASIGVLGLLAGGYSVSQWWEQILEKETAVNVSCFGCALHNMIRVSISKADLIRQPDIVP
jgi:hypothetical protein